MIVLCLNLQYKLARKFALDGTKREFGASQVALVKNPPANAGDLRDVGRSLGQEDPLEEGMATHSSSLAWEIPWTEEPVWLQSIGLQRVGYN